MQAHVDARADASGRDQRAPVHPAQILLYVERGVLRAQVVQAWSALLRAPTDPTRNAQVLQAYQALGLLRKDLTVQAYTTELAPALAEMQAWQIEPLTHPVFDFGTKTPPPITPSQHQRVLGQHLAQIPGEMPAFERMWMGLMHLLSLLGARVRTHSPAFFHRTTPRSP